MKNPIRALGRRLAGRDPDADFPLLVFREFENSLNLIEDLDHIAGNFLGRIKEAFDGDPGLSNLLLDPYFMEVISRCQDSWRRTVAAAFTQGIPVPAFSTALSFYDGYRTARLPANLLQAQRDYFGAHTYERLDKPRGQFFHTNWTGQGMDVSSRSYNA